MVAAVVAILLVLGGVGAAAKVQIDRNAAQEQVRIQAEAAAKAKSEAAAKAKAEAEAAAKAKAEAEARAKAEAEAKASKPYLPISAREFALVCKDPASYIGRDFTIWGEVTQFDSATGTDRFRASTGAAKLPIKYGMTDYTQNSFLSGGETVLADVVQGDCFGAKVIVLGSYSYDTQAGGNTTVPSFEVVAISRYGSTK